MDLGYTRVVSSLPVASKSVTIWVQNATDDCIIMLDDAIEGRILDG